MQTFASYEVTYTPWKFYWIAQWANTGSRWWFGNFTVGLHVDSHPQFFNVLFCLLFCEVGFGFARTADVKILMKEETCDCNAPP